MTTGTWWINHVVPGVIVSVIWAVLVALSHNRLWHRVRLHIDQVTSDQNTRIEQITAAQNAHIERLTQDQNTHIEQLTAAQTAQLIHTEDGERHGPPRPSTALEPR